jgi:hypothetical protein
MRVVWLGGGLSVVQNWGAAIVRCRVAYFGRAISRCSPAQIRLWRLRGREISLGWLKAVVPLALAAPALVGGCVGRAETIRDRGHEIVLIHIGLVLVVEDIGGAYGPRRPVVVAAASIHGVGQSVRPPEALSRPVQASRRRRNGLYVIRVGRKCARRRRAACGRCAGGGCGSERVLCRES